MGNEDNKRFIYYADVIIRRSFEVKFDQDENDYIQLSKK